MITPIRVLNIREVCGRMNDLLVSADDIKELAKNERTKAIEEFAEALNAKITEFVLKHQDQLDFVSGVGMGWRFVEEVAGQMKGE